MRRTEESDGWVSQRLPCPACGSSDARAVNDKGWSHCFSCHRSFPPQSDGEEPVDTAVPQEDREKRKGLLTEDLVVQALPSRGLSEEACKFFGYAVATARHPKTGEVEACHVAPY